MRIFGHREDRLHEKVKVKLLDEGISFMRQYTNKYEIGKIRNWTCTNKNLLHTMVFIRRSSSSSST